MPETSQFNIDRTHAERWTITFNNPPINIFVPSTIVELGALMTEIEADQSVKVIVFQSARHRQRVCAGLRHALRQPAKRRIW